MDYAACHVIYVNRSIREERLVRAQRDESGMLPDDSPSIWETDRIRNDIQPLLDAFGDGRSYTCAIGLATHC